MIYDLGQVKDLLYTQQLLREFSILVVRDEGGWAAMSSRCSYDGCDLSYQSSSFVCMCCQSVFRFDGRPTSGPARQPLPFFQMSFRDEHLFADAGTVVPAPTRFMTPELSQALIRLDERLRIEGARPGARIPEALLGKTGTEDPTLMFKERKEEAESAPPAGPSPSPTISLLKRFSFGRATPAPTPDAPFSPNAQ